MPSRASTPFLALLAIATLCGTAACADLDDSGEGGAGPEEPYASLAERPCPEDSVLTYENFGGPFMLGWCNGCHTSGLPEADRQGAPLGSDFDDITLIRAHKDRIWARSGDHNLTMPPAAGPEDEERAMLGEWLACGAKTQAELD